MEKESELRLLKTELQVQETTFQQISREIHDNIGQKLTLAKLTLINIGLTANQEHTKNQLAEIKEILTVALNDLRDLSRSMSSDMIRQNGLIKAIEFEMQQINKPGRYNIKLVVTGDVPFLNADMELTIFRMIQEALSNIMKHADATQIGLFLVYRDSKLIVEVKDNGCGFDQDEVGDGGNGLKNITARALSLNGDLKVYSERTKGTSIQISIPIT